MTSAFMKTGGRKSGPGALPGKVCDLATSSAASEMSTPRTRHLGIFSAIVQAMQPEPVHRSRIRTGWAAFPKAERDADILEPVLMASLQRISVSGRGMSTSGVTLKLLPQKSVLPMTYCTGSPSESRLSASRRVDSSLCGIVNEGSMMWV